MKSETNNKKTCRCMVDGCGVAVPVQYVSAYDKARDRKVRAIIAKAKRLRGELDRFVQETLVSMYDLTTLRDPNKMGTRGNFQCSSFDGLQMVEVSQRYNIFLDERVCQARDKMFAYVERVLGRVNPADAQALKTIIETSFRVGNNGMLSTSKVFQLLNMNINDQDWRDAQALLRVAVRPQKGKQYLRLFERENHQHNFRQILLDIADCWPSGFSCEFSRVAASEGEGAQK